MKFDKLDLKILHELQRDGSLTTLELADKIGLSATPCARRVKRLQSKGVISKTVTLLNREQINLNMTVIISISMNSHSSDCLEHFSNQIKQYPEIIECHLVAGQSYDFILKAVVSDLKNYEQLLLNSITNIKGVSGVHSSFVLREIVSKTQYPLDYVQ